MRKSPLSSSIGPYPKKEARMSETALPETYLETLSPYDQAELRTSHPGMRNQGFAQKKELEEMYRRFQSSKACFTEAYTKVTALEKAIARCGENWHN